MIARLFSAVALVAALSITTQAAASAPPTRLLPVDEASRDQSFVKFRNELKRVIARKDAAALFKFLAADIRLSFGDTYGGPEFHKMWDPFAKNTKVWAALSLVVDNGGKFANQNAFAAPYAYAALTDVDEIDAYTAVIVTNPNAVLRRAPNPSAQVIRKLDHDILERTDTAGKSQHEAGPNDWDRVKDARGQEGFVLSADVRSPIDYRIIFEKRKGQWMIGVFIAGD
jgi:hypothetical protein